MWPGSAPPSTPPVASAIRSSSARPAPSSAVPTPVSSPARTCCWTAAPFPEHYRSRQEPPPVTRRRGGSHVEGHLHTGGQRGLRGAPEGGGRQDRRGRPGEGRVSRPAGRLGVGRSEEHTSELQSLMRTSYAV